MLGTLVLSLAFAASTLVLGNCRPPVLAEVEILEETDVYLARRVTTKEPVVAHMVEYKGKNAVAVMSLDDRLIMFDPDAKDESVAIWIRKDGVECEWEQKYVGEQL